MGQQLACLALALAACGGAQHTSIEPGDASVDATMSSPDAGAEDAAATQDAATNDADVGTDLGSIQACATSGDGGIIAPGPCFVFTPVQAGLDPSGVNATTEQYALEPVTPKNRLVVQLNASLGVPEGAIVDPTKNIYNAIAEEGLHVIGLSYRSDDIIGALCGTDAACYSATRKTIVLGVPQPGCAKQVADITADEGIVQRLDAALRYLAAERPTGGWAQYIASATDPDVTKRIAWTKITTSGHSQGGGHAAYIGQLFPLHSVVQLSSTCDATGPTPAPWTDASATWATTPATLFTGFAAPTTFDKSGAPISGDTTCPYHQAVWVNMAMNPSRMHDDAATCGATGDTHSASIACTDNFPSWGPLYE